MWSGKTGNIPEGWALCDGTTFHSLTLEKTITTPDLQGRFIKPATDNEEINNTGGSNETTATLNRLTKENLPQHRHSAKNNGTNNADIRIKESGSHSHQFKYHAVRTAGKKKVMLFIE